MKKIPLLLAVLFLYACGSEDLAVQPDGTELQVADIITEAGEDPDLFMIVEDMPSFPGGNEAYVEFLGRNIKYPKKARDLGIEGKVYVTFIVNKDGALTDFQIIRGIGAGCDEEALRVLTNSPNWIPGKQRGRTVKTKMQAAITFKLDNKAVAMIQIQDPSLTKNSRF